MRILHYGLGYSPERTGGLIQYVTDLMKEQVKQNHEVAYLFPGKINYLNSSTKIKRNKSRIEGIISFEIINSLPLAVFGGIKEPQKFLKKVDHSIYSDLLEKFKPDVIHVHSLMGIHKEFFESASNKEIKLVYTTHDYFGLSPNPTFFFNGKSWDEENNLNYWLNVSQGAMVTQKLKVIQLPFYAKLRDTIKKFKKNSFQKESYYLLKKNEEFPKESQINFKKLKSYYEEIFKLINYFHFTSSLAKEVFEKNISHTINGELVSITNSTILGGKKQIKLDINNIKKVTYIGQYAEFKGFYDFIKLAESCEDKSIQFEIYGENIDIALPSNIINKGRFSAKEREQVFEDIELLIIPSRWKETFGFLVLEALFYEIPVLISKNVGARDIIPDFCILDKKKSFEFVVDLKSFKFHAREISNLYERATQYKNC
ncbi:glycosyltransferase [Lactococcus lactis]|uniref:glycosyltransferase n=1 Tax=Lactococcus lactis TaxID=1358 RepID=UPI001F10C127|nr:glycosyltransferase [Lactococcus lactis]MCH5427902.1 glycosyltransferase [Lactococcus lactis]MCT0086434.1 glycosyltransferase [Lactococcus lactis subsp. lactis]